MKIFTWFYYFILFWGTTFLHNIVENFFMIWCSWFDFINLKEFTLGSINYLIWESECFYYTTKIFLNKPVSLSCKTAYAIILANKVNWVSSQLFICGTVKLTPLGRRYLHHLFITELLLVWPAGHMNPRITHWFTKPSLLPWTGNLSVCQVVYSPWTVKTIIILHETQYVQMYQKRLNDCEKIC